MQEKMEVYKTGVQDGYQQTVKCQKVPLTLNNQSINIIALECLQQRNTTS
ncbi:MAG: hypothetical protein ACQER9_00460 [Nanobdellota archaeon]